MTNLVSAFLDQVKEHKGTPFFWVRQDAKFASRSWREVMAESAALARGLTMLGVGDGVHVAISGESPFYFLSGHLACLLLGAVTVPIPLTLDAQQAKEIIRCSDAAVALVPTDLAAALAKDPSALPRLQLLVRTGSAQWTLPQEDASPLPSESWHDVCEMGLREPDRTAQWMKDVRETNTAVLFKRPGKPTGPHDFLAITHGQAVRAAAQLQGTLGGEPQGGHAFCLQDPCHSAGAYLAGIAFPFLLGARATLTGANGIRMEDLAFAKASTLYTDGAGVDALCEECILSAREHGLFPQGMQEKMLAVLSAAILKTR